MKKLLLLLLLLISIGLIISCNTNLEGENDSENLYQITVSKDSITIMDSNGIVINNESSEAYISSLIQDIEIEKYPATIYFESITKDPDIINKSGIGEHDYTYWTRTTTHAHWYFWFWNYPCKIIYYYRHCRIHGKDKMYNEAHYKL